LSRRRTFVAGLMVCGFLIPVTQAHAAARISLGDRNLRQGMHGTDVRVLQDFLTKVGVKTSVDGQYGPTTTRHVKTWERKSSLRADGRMTRANAAILRGQVGTAGGALQGTGGVQPDGSTPAAPAPTDNATLDPDTGLATAPADAPAVVQQVIAAGNAIIGKPYRYGGGHGKWEDSGYDCSGSDSYALHGGGLIDQPMDSSEFESFGEAGPGQWITIYANSGHSFMVVAGLRFDTGYNDSSSTGPKWNTQMRPDDGYVVRHPDGL
jgi:Putative peptidoglycan binding domain